MKAVHFSTAKKISLEATVMIVAKIAVSEEMFKFGTRKLLCRGKMAAYAGSGLVISMANARTFRFD